MELKETEPEHLALKSQFLLIRNGIESSVLPYVMVHVSMKC